MNSMSCPTNSQFYYEPLRSRLSRCVERGISGSLVVLVMGRLSDRKDVGMTLRKENRRREIETGKLADRSLWALLLPLGRMFRIAVAL